MDSINSVQNFNFPCSPCREKARGSGTPCSLLVTYRLRLCWITLGVIYEYFFEKHIMNRIAARIDHANCLDKTGAQVSTSEMPPHYL